MSLAMILLIMVLCAMGLLGYDLLHIALIPIVFMIWSEYDKLEDRVTYLEWKIKNRSDNNESTKKS